MPHDWGVIAPPSATSISCFRRSYGDRLSPTQRGCASGLIYPLSLAIYCTSWTFFARSDPPPAPVSIFSRSMSARSR